MSKMRKHRIYKKYDNNCSKPEEWENVKLIWNETTRVIDQAKEGYFKNLAQRLCGPSKGIKAYWETIHKILNKKTVTCIPPLIENDIFHTNFADKASIFNVYFVKQCSLLVNESRLPDFLPYRTNCRLEHVEISERKPVDVINPLVVNINIVVLRPFPN